MLNKENNILYTQTQEGDFLPENLPSSTIIAPRNLLLPSTFQGSKWKNYEPPVSHERTGKSFLCFTDKVLTIDATHFGGYSDRVDR